jgi:flagellar basal-body rod protein FlgF
LAIHGDGFFVIGAPEGERYTRNGNFQIGSDGQIVTRNGDPLLSDSGAPFFLSPDDAHIEIDSSGMLSTENGELGKIAVVNFDNQRDMKIVANGLYSTPQQANPAEETKIAQGMLEESNVQPIVEMTRMIEIHRAYEGTKSFIQQEDERLKNMIKEYARVA